MGRVSKRKASGQQTEARRDELRYKAGIYARLSSDHGCKACGQASKNESVEVQVEIAKKFVEEFNGQKNGEVIDVVECYTDLGKTGSNFEREGFLRLLQDIRLGEINCVIVKDLSRFGRNYLEAGNYIEKIFPLLDVRFVAVEERFDTDNRKAGDGYIIPLKNMINELYSRDISKKVSTALAVRQRRGDFIGSWASYGYEKCADDPHRIQPDKDTAWVVQNIFQMRLLGMGYKDIADRLNEQGIDSPSHMRYLKGELINERYAHCKWQGQMIKKILSNLVYLGHMVQGRKRGTFYEGDRQKVLPESEWIVVKNTHEPIIDEKVFQAVQQMASGKGGVI